MALVRRVGYAACYSFKYSSRPGTPAAEMEGQVPEDVKTQRLHALQALLSEQESAFVAAQVGRTLPVLFEKAGRRPGQIVGRSPHLLPVHVAAPVDLVGTIHPVVIEGTGSHSLAGRLEQPLAGPVLKTA